MSELHRALQEKVHQNGVKVDTLMMCQNGMPTGKVTLTEDGSVPADTYIMGDELMIRHDLGFAVQALSRFYLAYHLIQSSGLAIGAMSHLSCQSWCFAGQSGSR